jgi:hypothetical protein
VASHKAVVGLPRRPCKSGQLVRERLVAEPSKDVHDFPGVAAAGTCYPLYVYDGIRQSPYCWPRCHRGETHDVFGLDDFHALLDVIIYASD